MAQAIAEKGSATHAEAMSHRGKLWILAMVPFIMVLGNSMLIPVLPKMMAVMHLSLFQVGLVVTVFSIPAGLIIPFAGALSDRIGRRVIMAPALVVYGLGGLAAGFAAWLLPHPYPWIMVGRVVQGIGAGGTYQLAMAVIGDMFPGSGRAGALGALEAANGAGKVASPIAGSALALVIWFLPFFVYGVLAIPVAAAIWWVLKEPAAGHGHGDDGMRRYLQGLRSTYRSKARSIAATFLGGAVVLFILFGVLSYLADVLEKNFGVAELPRGFLIAIPVAASAATSFVAGTTLQRQIAGWAKPMVTGGLSLIALAMAVEPFFATTVPAWALVILVLQGIGTGAVLPAVNTLVTSAVTRKERGVVTSLYGSVRFFGVALGPPAFSLAMGHRFAVFWSAAALALAAGAVAWWFINAQEMLPARLRQAGPPS